VIFFAFAVYSFFAYQNSVDDRLRELGNIIYIITISLLALLVLIGIAVIQKRWFLITPAILLALFWFVMKSSPKYCVLCSSCCIGLMKRS
jgi:hypothetical protein